MTNDAVGCWAGSAGALRIALPIFSTEEACGEVSVQQPETSGAAMAKHTTYLISGTLGSDGTPFSSRKRYSDFEWLRKALVTHLPGILVPPLPKKQVSGRFEEAFIESRRAGLEEFMLRCFRRRHIAMESPVFLRFLHPCSSSLEEVKKAFDNRPLADMCREYKVVFAPELRALLQAPDDRRLTECRKHLDGQIGLLRELVVALRETVDAQRQATVAAAGVQVRLARICSSESGVLADAHAIEQPRVELLAAIRQQNEVLADAPMLHHDLLLAAVERELDDTEAMREALASLDLLQNASMDAKKRAAALATSQARLLEVGDQPSAFSKLFGQKDRGIQLDELKRELENTSEEAVLAEEWLLVARTVAGQREVDGFLAEKVALHRWVKDSFSRGMHGTAERLAHVWGSLVLQ